FEDTWQFSDAYGNGGELIPSNSNIAPWYDDTSATFTTGAMSWQLNDENRVKVISYNIDPNSPDGNGLPSFFKQNYTTLPPCFRAFLPNGDMEEFGCTPDSLVYYFNDGSTSPNYKTVYVARWNLDMIVDPNGNQIHFTYTSVTNYDQATDLQFPIDTE